MLFTWIKTLKERFSHISPDSWHYQLVAAVWEYRLEGKACSYWWFKLPSSVLAGLVLLLFWICLAIGATFLGHLPNIKEVDTFPYKILPNGKRYPLAPWEVFVVAALLVFVNYLIWRDENFLLKLGLAAGATALIVLLFLTARHLHPIANLAKSGWNKACPTLTVDWDNK